MQIATEIDDAQAYDSTWIRLLLQIEPVGSGGLAWARYLRQTRNSHARGVEESWKVIRPRAFCHYRLRHDGVHVIDELVVMPLARRMGLATQLVESIQRPIEIHVPSTNTLARRWLAGMRFHLADVIDRQKGRTLVYRYD